MKNKKKILIIAETGISSKLFHERFQRFIYFSGSCAEVYLCSLNIFDKAMEEKRPTHILLAPNAYVLEEYVNQYKDRIDLDAEVVKLPNEDYTSMNIEKIMLDEF